MSKAKADKAIEDQLKAALAEKEAMAQQLRDAQDLIQAQNDTATDKQPANLTVLDNSQSIEEYIRERIQSALGEDAADVHDIALSLRVFNEDKKSWEDLGTCFENLSLADLKNRDALKNQIGETYGPGRFTAIVRFKNLIQGGFAITLSDRKFKKPNPALMGMPTGGGTSDALLQMMYLAEKERSSKAEERNHDLMTTLLTKQQPSAGSSAKETIEMALMLSKLGGKTDGDSLAKEMMLKVFDMAGEARESASSQEFAERMLGKFENAIPGLIEYFTKVKLAPVDEQPQVRLLTPEQKKEKAIEIKAGSGNGGNGGAKVTDPGKIDKNLMDALMYSGAWAAKIQQTYYNFAVLPPSRPDDPDAVADEISDLPVFTGLKTLILTKTDDEVIAELEKFVALGMLTDGVLKDAEFIKYLKEVFSFVRPEIGTQA